MQGTLALPGPCLHPLKLREEVSTNCQIRPNLVTLCPPSLTNVVDACLTIVACRSSTHPFLSHFPNPRLLCSVLNEQHSVSCVSIVLD
jgi:hypothetical protein